MSEPFSKTALYDDWPDLLTTEIRLHPEVSAVIGTRKGGASG